MLSRVPLFVSQRATAALASRALSTAAAPQSHNSSNINNNNSNSDNEADIEKHLLSFNSTDHNFDDFRVPKTADSVDITRTHQYLTVGTARFLHGSTIRLAVLKVLGFMAPGRDVLALGSVEVDLKKINMGSTATIKWRGKPVFIRRRSPTEIKAAEDTPISELRDPETDSARVKNPEWLVVLGICTHLGCVPIPNAGDYQGWFCPCHGSHYDTSGRVRAGPALKNLNIPKYSFLPNDKMILGA